MRTIFSITEALGVHRLFARLNRNSPIVLAFHGVTAEAPGHLCNYQGKHLHTPRFQRLMEHVAEHYHPVALSHIARWLRGEAQLPERPVAVTFDDGYRNVLTEAAPVLQRLGIPATLFVVTDFVFHGKMLWPDRLMSALALTDADRITLPVVAGGTELPLVGGAARMAADVRIRAVCKRLPDAGRIQLVDEIVRRLAVPEADLPGAWADHAPIDAAGLRALAEFGIDVGSHTCSHGIVARFASADMRRELAESKREIEAASGRPCAAFSYPNGAPGDFDAATRACCVAAGYEYAVTTIKRRVVTRDDRFEIPRCILADNQTTVPEFAAEVSGFPGFLRTVKARATGSSRERGSMN
ncbi:MAG TPA: polysaccharide deacetylase family protein [Candidatus Krumholzibacteria bacterium]|nr:polysaccharide deacetylase family protein [Candidatus Krumholzibacteria bacterium]